MKGILFLALCYPVTTALLLISSILFCVSYKYCPTSSDTTSGVLFAATLASALSAIILIFYNFRSWPKGLDKGSISKDSLLNDITIIEEIAGLLPLRSIYANRPRRPLLCLILWLTKSTQRKMMMWMGVDPAGIEILDACAMEKNVAGSVDFHRREICIDSKLKDNHPEAYLATLAREIAHLFARRFRVHSYIAGFEEDFTDALCVCLGLGDVMLNGCVSMSTTEEWCGNFVRRHYESLKVGYLTPLSLATTEVIVQEITRGCKKQRKVFNARAYSLLTDVIVWLNLHGIDYRNKALSEPLEYLRRLKSQIEALP